MGKINAHTIKKIVLICTLFGLFLPILELNLDIAPLDPLEGDIERKELPVASLDSIKSGVYQKGFSDYFKNQFGFHELFIRLNNQKKFSLFGEISAYGVVMGKEGYLYEENYIFSHLGRDFIGEDSIEMKIRDLEKIRDTLRNHDKELLVIFAPGKGSFYPEYIPEKYNPKEKTTSNYDVYSKKMEESDIPFINFHEHYNSLKGKTDYTIYPKNGIHWSKYVEFIALDSIVNYISSEFNYSMGQFIMTDVNKSTIAWDTDNDIEKGMNLLFPLPSTELHYPVYEFQQKKNNGRSPRVLTISDSFYWGMFNMGASEKVFNDGEFWFYNEEIFPSKENEESLVAKVDLKKKIDEHDVIIIMCTETNLYRFPFKFDEMFFLNSKHKKSL